METYQVIELIKESKLFAGSITDTEILAAKRFADLVQRRSSLNSKNKFKCVLLDSSFIAKNKNLGQANSK